jgi:cell wall-associated NlpC family hydrolase
MLRKISLTTLIMGLIATSFVFSFADALKKVEITASVLNVRESDTTNSRILDQLMRGEVVKVTNSDSKWYSLTLKNGSKGFIHSKYTKQVPKIVTEEVTGEVTEEVQFGCINNNHVNFRTEPTTRNSNNIIKQFNTGDVVNIIARENGWYNIVDLTGNAGYVYNTLVTVGELTIPEFTQLASTDKQDAVANIAKQQLGKRYVWGAEGPNVFDCSGLIYYAYREVYGDAVRTTAFEYSEMGTTIDKENLLPGDVVFFNSPGSSKVSHTGIYIGGGEFIHASRSYGYSVVKSSLSQNYYINHYVRSKRII